jgi:lysozyme family protein
MKALFEQSLAKVLEHEGGWSDHPSDPGGATMKGVTLATYSKFLGRPATKEQLRAISDAELGTLYRNGYWDACKCDELPAGLDYLVFDLAVNGGPGRAAKTLQAAVGANPDGAIGPATLKAVNQAVEQRGLAAVAKEFSQKRQAFYEALPTFAVFGKGWTRRVNDSFDTALSFGQSDGTALA